MTDTDLKPIDRLGADWAAVCRSAESGHALALLAAREEAVAALGVSDLGGLVDGLRRPEGATQRDDAGRVVQAMIRSQAAHPLMPRAILQAVLPGLVAVARRLSWGSGGDWTSGGAFFVDVVTTAWEVIVDWAGDDRPYAVLDLLSAVRCRLRRQLLSQRAGRDRVVLGMDLESLVASPWRNGSTDLDELARTIDAMAGNELDRVDAAVLYGNGVLGMTITELSDLSGVSRRHLGGCRKRALTKIVA